MLAEQNPRLNSTIASLLEGISRRRKEDAVTAQWCTPGQPASADPTPADQSRSTTQGSAPNVHKDNANNEELALVKTLEDLQRQERIAQLWRNVN